MDPDERQLKWWGEHYDTHRYEFLRGQRVVLRQEDLHLFSSSFYDDYLIERLSAVGFDLPSNEVALRKVDL
jgi:hypothetical protein